MENVPMPIPFRCACGKKLQAKDEYAGKKLKCPGCGAILTIPRASAVATPPPAAAVPPPAPVPPQEVTAPPTEPPPADAGAFRFEAAPPPASPAPAVVQFVCNCGRRLKGRQADAGEQIECPDCGRTLQIPAADTDEPPPAR